MLDDVRARIFFVWDEEPMSTLNLPSRYEDLDNAFRGRLKPNQPLLDLVKTAFAAMRMSGGIRFAPVFGESGSGKTSAALEIGTHLPDLFVAQLPRTAIEDTDALQPWLSSLESDAGERDLVVVIDQYEEVAAQKTAIPSTFVERLSLLDRESSTKKHVLFLWLTTSKEFQRGLVGATSRNRRILLRENFEIEGLPRDEWPAIIEETFQFNNQEKSLSDFEILDRDLAELSSAERTLGSAIEATGMYLAEYQSKLQDLSNYMVVLLWPVTDGLRISRVQQFTDPRPGYKLDWTAYYRQLNLDDQQQLSVREYNRARLYFDIRLVPIAAADLAPLCRDIENPAPKLGQSYLSRLKNTHLYSVVAGTWNPETYSPLRERESQRAHEARE